MSFLVVFQKIIQLFLILLVGFAANKMRFFDRDLREKVTALILNITLPGVILSTVWNEPDLPSARQFLLYFALAALFYLFAYVFGLAASKLIPFPYSIKGLVRFVLMFGTVGFMGYPVVQSIFGQKGVFYTTMVNLPHNILITAFGAAFLLQDRKAMREHGDPAVDGVALPEEISGKAFAKEDVKKLLLSPVILSSLAAFFFALTRIPVPAPVSGAADTIGQITTPAAMLIIGSSLAETRFRELFSDKWVYVILALRMAVMPILVFLIFRRLSDDPLFVSVLTVLSGMPVARMGQMMAVKYRVNEGLMARSISLSVLLCGITIPLIATGFAVS